MVSKNGTHFLYFPTRKYNQKGKGMTNENVNISYLFLFHQNKTSESSNYLEKPVYH